ncbi:hepatic lectin-like [Symphorus nematophorus]
MRRPHSDIEGEAPAFQQRSVSTGGSKFTPERVGLLVVSALLAAAVIVIIRLSFAHMDTLRNFQPLRHTEQCLKYKEDCEKHGDKCYYFSSDRSPWEKARDECRSQGGDLVQIDSRDEQSFLVLKVREKMNDPEDRFWIGLTDSEVEGTWVWVDGSPLNNSVTFWVHHEPDNWTTEDPDGEDCVRMGVQGESALNSWFDKSCKVPHRRICEKSAKTGCD